MHSTQIIRWKEFKEFIFKIKKTKSQSQKYFCVYESQSIKCKHPNAPSQIKNVKRKISKKKKK